MKKIVEFIKNNTKVFEGILALGGIGFSVIAFVQKYIAWEWLAAIGCLVLFILSRFILREASKPNLNEQAENKTTSGVRYRLLGYGTFLLLIPIPIFIYYLERNDDICQGTVHTPLVVITNFSPGQDDDFSYAVISAIGAKTDVLDSIELLSLDTFINQQLLLDKTALNSLMLASCHDKGLVVYGKRSVNGKYFECTIYVSSELQKQFANISSRNSNLIRVKNPDEINFSIEKQSEVVAQVVLSLLDYYRGKFRQSTRRFGELTEIVKNSGQQDLIYLSSVLWANSIAFDQGLDAGINAYKSIVRDSIQNPLISYNYAQLCLANNDSATAYAFFEQANMLDFHYTNPLKTNPVQSSNVSSDNIQVVHNENIKRRDSVLTPSVISREYAVEKLNTSNSSNNKSDATITSTNIKSENGMYYLINSNGIKCSAKYKQIIQFDSLCYAVDRDGAWGIIGCNGYGLTPTVYRSFEDVKKIYSSPSFQSRLQKYGIE